MFCWIPSIHFSPFSHYLSHSFLVLPTVAFFKIQPACWRTELISSQCFWTLLVLFFSCYPLWFTLPRNMLRRECWRWWFPLQLPFWHHRGVGSDLTHTRITRKMSHTQARRTKAENDAHMTSRVEDMWEHEIASWVDSLGGCFARFDFALSTTTESKSQ